MSLKDKVIDFMADYLLPALIAIAACTLLIGGTVILCIFFWLLSLVMWIIIAGLLLFLISLTGLLPFSWINAILLGFGFRILTQIFPLRITVSNNA